LKSSAQNQLRSIPLDASDVVRIDLLEQADSPRLDGEDPEHIRALAQIGAELPPLLVHRDTMRVIDGMHRLRAAILNEQREIRVRYFDGPEKDAFVAAVAANVGHGLPLSLADREAAAARIIRSHPQWSDRAIAEATGIAATTVARIRIRAADSGSQPSVRIGRDGRVRPINSAAGRRLASRLITDHPGASLREIAEAAGISPATVKDVRERVRRGDDPVPHRQALAERRGEVAWNGDEAAAAPGSRPPAGPLLDPASVLQKLRRDPSLRLTENGRQLLRRLSACAPDTTEWEGHEAQIPVHCVPLVSELALGYAEAWTRFAEELTRRARTEMA
jgi:ParB-like chromosome segregation protein Spo0J